MYYVVACENAETGKPWATIMKDPPPRIWVTRTGKTYLLIESESCDNHSDAVRRMLQRLGE